MSSIPASKIGGTGPTSSTIKITATTKSPPGTPEAQDCRQNSRKFGKDETNSSMKTTNGKKTTIKIDRKDALKEAVLKVQKEVATLAPTLELNSAITTTRLMEKLQRQQASQKTLKHPAQCKIDLAFHYTKKQNIELIKANGLMTMQERNRNNVKSASFQGTMYNDGIYTGNNPFSFSSYGNTGIVLARLCGERYDSIERVHYKDQIDKDFKSVIIGNKHKPFDHKQLFDEVVLQFGSQVVPLMTYSKSAVDPSVVSNQKNVDILYKACDVLLESINRHWNTKSMGRATIVKYSIEDFLDSVQFHYYWNSVAFARPIRKCRILPASKAKNATKKFPPSTSIGPKSKTRSTTTNIQSNPKNSTKSSSGHWNTLALSAQVNASSSQMPSGTASSTAKATATATAAQVPIPALAPTAPTPAAAPKGGAASSSLVQASTSSPSPAGGTASSSLVQASTSSPSPAGGTAAASLVQASTSSPSPAGGTAAASLARAPASSLSPAGGTAAAALARAATSSAAASSAAAQARVAARPIRKHQIIPKSKATENATKKLPPSTSIDPKSKTTSATNMRTNPKTSTKLLSGHDCSCFSKSFESVKEAVSKSFEFMKKVVLCCSSGRNESKMSHDNEDAKC